LSNAISISDDIRERGEFLSPEAYTKDFLKELSNEIKRLERYKKEQAAIESERTRLKSLCINIPDLLLRYPVFLDRAFDRTLKQLERAQRIRRGEPVAPRIDIDVS